MVRWFFFVWVAVGQAVVGLTGSAYLVSAFGLSDIWLYLLSFLFLVVALVANLLGMQLSGRFSLVLSITHLVPEFRNPKRDVMRSTWASVFLIGIVYTLLSVVTVGTRTYGENGTAAPLAVLMSQTLGLSAGIATAFIACVVCLGTLNVFLASSSRLGYALARDRKFPRWFEKLSDRGVPYRNTVFLFGTNTTTLVLCYLCNIPVDKLILVPTTLGIFVYVIASFSCVKLLWHDRIGRVSSLLTAACCLMVAPFAVGYLIVPILVAFGCLLYLWFRNLKDSKGDSYGRNHHPKNTV